MRDCCLSETLLAEETNFAKCSISWLGVWLLSRGGGWSTRETTSEEGALLWGWKLPWGRCEVQRALQSCPIKAQGHLVMGCPMELGWCWGRHQACCHLLALVNNTAMNTEYISNSLGIYQYRSTESYGNSVFNSFSYFHTISTVSAPFYIPSTTHMSSSFSIALPTIVISCWVFFFFLWK